MNRTSRGLNCNQCNFGDSQARTIVLETNLKRACQHVPSSKGTVVRRFCSSHSVRVLVDR